jgi:hypothetical protein
MAGSAISHSFPHILESEITSSKATPIILPLKTFELCYQNSQLQQYNGHCSKSHILTRLSLSE